MAFRLLALLTILVFSLSFDTVVSSFSLDLTLNSDYRPTKHETDSISKRTTTATTTSPIPSNLVIDGDDDPNNENNSMSVSPSDPILVVFSDVDGTLVHYPPMEELEELPQDILRLPASMTGLQGIISSRTLQLCRSIRNDRNTKFVLISGMRTQTLLKRIPYLPRADAYCSEAGGRIFYPRPLLVETNALSSSTSLSSSNDEQQQQKEVPVFVSQPFIGSTQDDRQPFCLVEDMEWRRRMEHISAAGMDGYIGNEVSSFVQPRDVILVTERQGELWKFALQLQEQGFILDTKGSVSSMNFETKTKNES